MSVYEISTRQKDCLFFMFKIGTVDLEINTLTKMLFLAVMVLSVLMMILKVSSECPQAPARV